MLFTIILFLITNFLNAENIEYDLIITEVSDNMEKFDIEITHIVYDDKILDCWEIKEDIDNNNNLDYLKKKYIVYNNNNNNILDSFEITYIVYENNNLDSCEITDVVHDNNLDSLKITEILDIENDTDNFDFNKEYLINNI